ncbi:MAG: hypothetical protein ABGY41_01720 [Candidatus Poribacteria bacterium]
MTARRLAKLTWPIAILALALCACVARGDELADALERARALRVTLDAATVEATAVVNAATARITAQHAESVAAGEASVRERQRAASSPRGEFETEDDYAARIAVYREGLPAFVAE